MKIKVEWISLLLETAVLLSIGFYFGKRSGHHNADHWWQTHPITVEIEKPVPVPIGPALAMPKDYKLYIAKKGWNIKCIYANQMTATVEPFYAQASCWPAERKPAQ